MGIRGGGRVAFFGAIKQVFGCHGTLYSCNNQTIAEGATYTTGDVRDGTVVPANAVGVVLFLQGQATAAPKYLCVESADDTPDGYSGQLISQVANVRNSGLQWVRLGTGANAGKIKIKAVTGAWSSVYAWPVGYWK